MPDFFCANECCVAHVGHTGSRLEVPTGDGAFSTEVRDRKKLLFNFTHPRQGNQIVEAWFCSTCIAAIELAEELAQPPTSDRWGKSRHIITR